MPETYEISKELHHIEIEKQVKILYACESGSRAWGFASQDSDYDIRFIYVHKTDWYLSIEDRKDVIELPIQGSLDINGWDLRKALQLLRKTNPPLLEWMNSPIVYYQDKNFISGMRTLAEEYYSPHRCMYHYLHMASHNYREYLQGEEVWIKKYFYVLRPILAMNWIESELGVPPTDFNVMLNTLNIGAGLRSAIDLLLEAKLAGDELKTGKAIPEISSFIVEQLTRYEAMKFVGVNNNTSSAKLDAFFMECLYNYENQ